MRYTGVFLAGTILCSVLVRESRPAGAIAFVALGALVLYFQRSLAEQSLEIGKRRAPATPVAAYLPTLETLRSKPSYWLFSWRAAAALSIVFGIGLLVLK